MLDTIEEFDHEDSHTSDEEGHDYAIENDNQPKHNPDPLNNEENSDEECDNLDTNIKGTESGNSNSKKRIKKEVAKMKKLKAEIKSKTQKSSPRKSKKANQILGLDFALRDETLSIIEMKLNKILVFRADQNFIKSSAKYLEQRIYEFSKNQVNDVY